MSVWIKGEFPNIERAVKEMGYDNGAIHRAQTEESLMQRVMTYLCSTFLRAEMVEVDVGLGFLSNDDFMELVTGEADKIVTSEIMDRLLNEAFDAL